MFKILEKVRARLRTMPADSLTVAVTTGLGFSVLAGIVSGVCYILTYGLPHTRRKRLLTPWQCSICGRHFRSIDGVLEVDKVATCVQCGRKSCKEKCSTREPAEGWLCNKCKPDTWFASLLNVLQPGTSKGWCSAKKMDQTTIDEIDEDLLALQKKEREQVRDFIERLVGALLGGDLDDVSVKKIYNDVKYLPISGQSPCSAHATLKLLIQKFIQEAVDLPKLRRFEDHPAIPDDSKDRTYEDLLSTAIINKVIQNNQQGAPSRSVSSRASSKRRSDKEYFFGERNLDPRRVHDDTSSLSSLDSDTMSLKIRGCIKEVSSSGDETKDEDEVDVGRKKSNEWQDNWRLQKRKYDGTTSPVPVPMLVPDPITEAKVLIGDRDAEDTTDLSDAASDYEEALEPATLNSVLVNSRTVIGGRSPLESLVSKAESISEDGSTDATDLLQEKEDIVKTINGVGDEEPVLETSNDHLIEQKDTEDSSLISIDSNTEKDLEYTERYASLPRTIYKCPKPTPRQSKVETEHFDDLPSEHEHKTDNVDSGVTSDEDEKQRIFKGTYSEREKEKWNHAVPLSNNPYSKSNLERRLSYRSSNSSINSSFDRDYYIREAAKSTGARKGLTSSNSQEDEVKKSPEIEEKTIEPKFKQTIFKATPAVIEDEVDSSIEPTRPNHQDLSSDSDYSMERTYNIETGQVIRKPGSFRKEIIKSSPEGLKYLPKDFDVDENQNKLSLENEKRNFLRSLTHDDDVVDTNSSALDSSFEEVRPPLVNHFRLVEEIANETSDQYDNTPLSPPAEYKSIKEQKLSDDVLINLDETNEENFIFDTLAKSKALFEAKAAELTPEINHEIKLSKITTPEIIRENPAIGNRELKVTPEIKSLSKQETELFKTSPKITENTNVKTTPETISLSSSSTTAEIKSPVTQKEFGSPTDFKFEKLSEKSKTFIPKIEPELRHSQPNSLPDKLNHASLNDDQVKFIKENLGAFKDKIETVITDGVNTDSTEDFSLTYSEVSEPEAEIIDLKGKQLVNNLLGEFSKSFPNLSKIPAREPSPTPATNNGYRTASVDISEVDDDDDLPSVRRLSKIFDSNKNGKQEQVYSLTARSIPKQFRQELKKEPSALTCEVIKEVVSSEAVKDEKVLPFPKAKSKIEFFEKLKK